MSYASTMTSSLELPARPAPSAPSPVLRVALIVAAVLVPLSWFVWFINTPPGFDTRDTRSTGATLAGSTAYVGMYASGDGFDREIRIAGIKVDATANTEVEIEPMICRAGSLGVTTRPEQFCSELIPAQGEEFAGGDSIALRITSQVPAIVELDRIRIGFHQDLRSATEPAGIAGATVTFTARGGG